MTYVRACWSKTAYEIFKTACFWSRQARAPLYTLFSPLFDAVQARLLKSASVLVAANPEDDEQVFGCLVFERASTPVLHFIAVKRDFQGKGIAHLLLAAAEVSLQMPAVFSLGIPPRIVRGEKRSRAVVAAPKAWVHVPYGLMP